MLTVTCVGDCPPEAPRRATPRRAVLREQLSPAALPRPPAPSRQQESLAPRLGEEKGRIPRRRCPEGSTKDPLETTRAALRRSTFDDDRRGSPRFSSLFGPARRHRWEAVEAPSVPYPRYHRCKGRHGASKEAPARRGRAGRGLRRSSSPRSWPFLWRNQSRSQFKEAYSEPQY
jgi:hypothetical protein